MFKPVVRYYEFRDQQNYSLEEICSFIGRVPFERPFSWSVRSEKLIGIPDGSQFNNREYVNKVVVTKQASTRLKVEIELGNLILLLVLVISFFGLVMAMYFFCFGTSYLDTLVPLIGSIYLPSVIFIMRRNQRIEFTDYLERILGLEDASIN